jgi:hypothetical protein
MPRLIDRVGFRYGRLTVLQQAGRSESKKVLWACRCDCGEDTCVTAGDLTTGNTVSCGCYLQERITTHGGSRKASYNTWRAMMRRCYKPQDKDYPRYGGVGVSVHSAWHEYETFAAAMGEPKETETLDRIDPYGNYEPSNCRWATVRVQNRNQRVRRNNEAGCAGVSRSGAKWMAQIKHNGKSYYSIVVDTAEAAIVERRLLELRYWEA